MLKETLARRIAARDLLQLDEIGAVGVSVFVDAIEVRFVPEPYAFEVGRPLGGTRYAFDML